MGKYKYYEVEAILAHRRHKDNIKFKIKWMGYEDDEATTWEPPKCLNRCRKLVEEYCAKKRIDCPLIPSGSGATDNSQEHNENLWPEVEVIKKMIDSRKSKCRSNLPVMIFDANNPRTEPTGNNALYIYYRESHTYVVLHYPGEKRALVADGSNDCLVNQEFSSELEEVFPDHDIQFLEFKSQTSVDHCASSAVMLGLRFLALDATKKDWPTAYWAPSKSHKLIKDQLYKSGRSKKDYKSNPLNPNSNNLIHRQRIRCRKPGCSYSKNATDLRAFEGHHCPKRATRSNVKSD